MVYMEGGTANLGDNNNYPVDVASFFINRYEVSQDEWYVIMGENPSNQHRRNYPVDQVNWFNAQRFTQKLSQLSGLPFRLPFEAEWEYAAHEAVYFSQAITADDFAMKKNPKYVNKVVAPTLEPISSIGGFRTLPDYSFDTMPDDYVALVLIGGFGWNTPVAEKVMPIIKSAIEQEKVIGAICNAASFMAKCGIDRETTSKTLQKSSVIQKISVTLSSVIIAIIVCKLLIFNTLRLQQFFANHHFSGTYISSNSR